MASADGPANVQIRNSAGLPVSITWAVCKRGDCRPSYQRLSPSNSGTGTLLSPEATEGASPLNRLGVDTGRTSGTSGLVNLVSRSNEYRTLQGENRDGFRR